MTHTKDLLAEALRKVGLNEMADKAATGWYHDFLSPLDLPEMTLINNLEAAAKTNPDRSNEIMTLRADIINGDYDASREESEAWANSPEGQAALQSLARGRR